jgi:mRNA interferase MazF
MMAQSASPAASAAGPAIRRGEVWWVDFEDPDDGEMRRMRPAVVISADALNRARHSVVVVPLVSGAVARPPLVIATPSAGARLAAVCDQARAIDKARLTHTAGQLSSVDLRAVEDGLRRILDL